MTTLQVIPTLRIFDYDKAVDFYVHWLGFKIDWEHRFEENAPVYLQVSKENIVFHLSEHHGDCTPGAKVFIVCKDIREYHTELIEKKYKYNRPGIGETFYNALSFEVIDPFHNQISFNEYL